MLQQVGVAATPSYHGLGANSLPMILLRSSSGESAWGLCSPILPSQGARGERKVRRMFPCAKSVKRNRVKKKRRGERAQDGRTHALVTGPFKHFPTMKASALPPTTAELSREKFCWR